MRSKATAWLLRNGVFWGVVAAAVVVIPQLTRDQYFLTSATLVGLYGAVNLMWMLVLGTAGLFSFATMGIVGGASYAAAFLSIKYGLPWPAMIGIGLVAGGLLGIVVGAPALRIRGVYFALVTFGLVQVFFSLVVLRKDLGYSTGLYGAGSFIPDRFVGSATAAIVGYYGAGVLLLVTLLVYAAVDGSRLGLRLRVARESEEVAAALGVNVAVARMAVFVISSAMLGVAGAFYAALYRGVSPGIFDINQLLILFAMIVIGGVGSAKGVVLATAFVVFVDARFVQYGPYRFIAIGALMMVVTLLASNGLGGIPAQALQWGRSRRTRTRIDAHVGEVSP